MILQINNNDKNIIDDLKNFLKEKGYEQKVEEFNTPLEAFINNEVNFRLDVNYYEDYFPERKVEYFKEAITKEALYELEEFIDADLIDILIQESIYEVNNNQ